jgi:hypothetical protein
VRIVRGVPGYFKVKLMKKYYSIIFLLLLAKFAVAENNYECTYLQSARQDLVSEEHCLTYTEGIRNSITGGDAFVSEKVAATALYDKNGLSYLFSNVGIFYFTKSGLARRALTYDNGPDYFKNGLARTKWNEKIGFFDHQLSIVIDPKYDFAFPFMAGISRVCMGCRPKKDGEHTEIIGGKWGAINLKGEIVHPIIYSKPELERKLK